MKKDNKKSDNFHQPQVVALFALVGLSITAIMGLISLYNSNFILAGTLFLASAVYFFGYYVHKKHNNITLSAATILYSLYLLMFYLVFSGGVENTGPLWVYIVAPVTVFIHGLKRGLCDLAAFIVICIALTFIPQDFIAHAVYATEFKLRLLYSFLTITFLSALYEHSRNLSYQKTQELSEKYQHLAHFDSLTNLSNRRNALLVLEQEQARVARNQEPLSVIICDVDFFKIVNDKYGHNAGDIVLKALSKLFTDNIRAQDHIARWGGEEFLFILPQTSANNACIIAEKIRLAVEKSSITFQNISIDITVSLGIAQFEASQSIDEVINNADKHLYQAKELGRNQIYPCPDNIEQLKAI
ncbi:GGDEF domain-containing protein [Thalassotalea sp. PLHSN55]|uniref:GGDEF domain-containing protein n=1 Tax=Thalassotalea sp. PLHSN55 TaxID=3435888 RepID=UPI003F82F75F